MVRLYGLEYTVLLNTVAGYFDIRRVRDYAKPADGKVCLLRHDVDHDMGKAVKMAEIEYDLNIQSTYFVLHTAEYYKDADFIRKCSYVQELGHEIGLHNNIITVAIGDPYITLGEILARELAFLRDGGIDVRGTVAHGDDLCHELNYINYQIFKGCEVKKKPDNVSGVEFYKIDMAEHGLDYEALFIKRHSYLSDSGGKWSWNYPKKAEPIEGHDKSQDVIAHIGKLGAVEGELVLQILVHPTWWAL